jgi:hypothetical protein
LAKKLDVVLPRENKLLTLSCKGTWRVEDWVGSGRFGNRSITAGGGRGLHLKTMSDLNNIYNLTITIPKTKN